VSTTPFSWRGWDERSALWPVARATPGCSNATGRCSVCRSILLWSGGWEGVVSVDAMREGALAAIPRITLTREDAAAALGMSLDSFERYVQPHLRLLRLGRMVLVPVGELRRWADDVAERAV
jgi:hypothetical protein